MDDTLRVRDLIDGRRTSCRATSVVPGPAIAAKPFGGVQRAAPLPRASLDPPFGRFQIVPAASVRIVPQSTMMLRNFDRSNYQRGLETRRIIPQSSNKETKQL